MVHVALGRRRRVDLDLVFVVREAAGYFLFAAVPLLYGVLFALIIGSGFELFDFHAFWSSGRAVLEGHSPYPHVLPTHAVRDTFRPFVYPAPAAVAMVPFAAMPLGVATVLWSILGIASVVGALLLLDVRDWRCYGAVFAWPAIWSSLLNGAISVPLVLGCAALWRYRSRPLVAGTLVAALVVLKLYLWPLGLWLLATRRWRASAVAVVTGVVATAGSWALMGFAGLRTYPALLDRLTALVADQSYSPYALVRALGASAGTSRLVVVLAGLPLLAALVRASSERLGFVLAVAASLALTPIVWPHYLALPIVPAALARPRLGFGWVAPMGLWYALPAWSGGDAWRIAATVGTTAVVVSWCARETARPARTARLLTLLLRARTA